MGNERQAAALQGLAHQEQSQYITIRLRTLNWRRRGQTLGPSACMHSRGTLVSPSPMRLLPPGVSPFGVSNAFLGWQCLCWVSVCTDARTHTHKSPARQGIQQLVWSGLIVPPRDSLACLLRTGISPSGKGASQQQQQQQHLQLEMKGTESGTFRMLTASCSGPGLCPSAQAQLQSQEITHLKEATTPHCIIWRDRNRRLNSGEE